MAQERPFTPEKQLLKLIEDPKLKPDSFNSLAIKHQGMSWFSPSAWLGRFSFLKDWAKKQFQKSESHGFDTKAIIKILIVCVLGLGAYFITNIIGSFATISKPGNFSLGAMKEDVGAISTEDSFVSKKAVTYFLDKIRQRDIFKMGQVKKDDTEFVPRGPTSRIIEATAHLKLVGISWSDDPDAMIEDTKALRTFFVKRGGMVGEIKIQAIFKDKVILSYGGEELEIR